MDSSNVKQEVASGSRIESMSTTSEQLAALGDDDLRKLADQGEELTLEQCAVVHLHARRETQRALRRYRNSSVVGFLILLVGLFAVRFMDLNNTSDSRTAIARSGNAVAVNGCNRDYTTQAIQRFVLVQNFQLTRKRAELLVPLPDCTKVAGLITDDPHKDRKVPKPLSPKDEGEVIKEFEKQTRYSPEQ